MSSAFMEIASKIKHKQIADLIKREKRLDGRTLTEYRDIEILVGPITKAEGSAQVSLGKTKVLVGVKIDIGEPFPDTPEDGVLTVNSEFLPLASPSFETGPPDENSIELARVVDRGLRESKVLDTKKLCILPGKKVFVIFVDIYILDHDGNLFDASALASLVAVITAKIPNYEIEDGEVKILEGLQDLPVQDYPIATTFAKIDNSLIVDPTLEEESAMEGRLTITTKQNGNICAMQKGLEGTFTVEEIQKAVITAQEKGEELRAKALGVRNG
ncbi:MAG TPA: exosome complex protein Rrp42 [Candidatus Bathyarchaeia archaeon]|nr:MAG: RNA-binding protein [Candidatus Bathyarchaeota archaeon RBG_16_48_13]HJX23156.1 exosome complex protein Rrp42 [Candidatus Bathyarchaeia archaeon]